MLKSRKNFRALRDKKNIYSNSCVVRKKNRNDTKNHNPPLKLNGRSLITTEVMVMVFNATLDNILAISLQSVLKVEETGKYSL